MTGKPGKWPWKNHSVAVTPFWPTIRCAAASYSTMRSTSRNGQRCGMSASISRVVWIVSVTCRSPSPRPSRRGARRGGEERGAADAIEEVRRDATLEERLVLEQGPVDLDVRRQAVDDELAERRLRTHDRRRPIRTPDDELAEERVVERRHLVSG